jgi:tetratricopeptide (TPR) repeat protein
VGIGELERSEALLTDAVEAASAAGSQQALLHVQLIRAQLHMFTDPEGSTAELARVAEGSLSTFEELADDRGLAMAWSAIGWVRFGAGRYQDAGEASERSLVHARAAGREQLVNDALASTGVALMYGPLPAEAVIERCQEVLEGERLSMRVETAYLDTLAYHEAMRGRFDVARELLARGRGILRDLGLTAGMPTISAAEHAFLIELLAGDPAAAEREIRPACELLEQMGDKGLFSTQAARLAMSLYGQGRYEEAERYTELSEEAGASDDFATQAMWRQARAKVLAQRGEYEEAEILAREAVELGEPTDALDMRAEALRDLAEVLQHAGKSDEARQALDRALELFEQKGNIVSAARVNRALAELESA